MNIINSLVLSIISLTLMFMPVEIAKAACNYANDPELSSQQTACANDAGKEWSCELNRCMYKEEATEMRTKYQDCAKKEGIDAQKACYEEVAKEYTGDLKNSTTSAGLDYTKSAVYGACFALAIVNLVAGKQPGGACMSKTIFMVAAVAGVAAEIYQYFFLGKKLKQLQETYKAKVTESNGAYANQVAAFEYLRDEQKEIAKMAKTKAMLYMVLTAAYGVALVMAIYEIIKGPPKCGGGEAAAFNNDQQGPSFIDNFIPAAYAAETKKSAAPFIALLLGGAATAGLALGVKSIGKFLGSPTGIAILSGIAAALSLMLMMAAKKQQKEAEENAALVEKILAQFQSSMAGFCPNGHDSLAEPKCYCYKDGKRNTDHANSETCKALWAKDGADYYVDPNSGNALGSGDIKGCMTLAKEFDPTCNCRKLKDTKTGQNACYKSGFNKINFGAMGSKLGTSTLGSQLDKIYEGDIKGANLDSGALGKKLADIDGMSKDLLKQANKDRAASGLPALDLNGKSLAAKLIKTLATPEMLALGKDGGLAQNANSDGSRPTTGPEGAALKEAMTKFDYESAKKTAGWAKKEKDENFNFSGGNDSGGGKVVGDYMNKEYNFKQDDIVKNSGVSIWQVLTNRYNQSGLKRLFDDSPPPPSPTATQKKEGDE